MQASKPIVRAEYAWIGEVDRFAMTVIDPRPDARSGRNARPVR